MKVILGSGIVALLARFVLGDEWTIVPFYRSRFYSYNPPLGDNFVSYDDELTPILAELGVGSIPVVLKRAYSVGGQLLGSDQDGQLGRAWLAKWFGGRAPGHAEVLLASRMNQFVFSEVHVNKLYELLLNRYSQELMRETAQGKVTAVGDHYLIRGEERFDFERAVSTIPANVLLKLMGQPCSLEYAPVYYMHMATEHLDFEGYSQVLVVDELFDFCQVSSLAPQRYLFQCHRDIPNPGAYFMPIIADYDLLDGAKVPEALPIGPMPNWSWLEGMDIFPVGAYAQHDWCADVGSNLLRIVRYANRGQKPGGFRKLSVNHRPR